MDAKIHEMQLKNKEKMQKKQKKKQKNIKTGENQQIWDKYQTKIAFVNVLFYLQQMDLGSIIFVFHSYCEKMLTEWTSFDQRWK